MKTWRGIVKDRQGQIIVSVEVAAETQEEAFKKVLSEVFDNYGLVTTTIEEVIQDGWGI